MEHNVQAQHENAIGGLTALSYLGVIYALIGVTAILALDSSNPFLWISSVGFGLLAAGAAVWRRKAQKNPELLDFY